MHSVMVYIVVEGQTEQTFIRDVLAPVLGNGGIYLYPVIIGKSGHKGGDIRFERAKNDIGLLLKQQKDSFVSTMFDYFGIDSEWPGKPEVTQQLRSGNKLSAIHKAVILEKAMQKTIGDAFPGYNADRRFIPYIAMHEFEALLFSDAKILSDKISLPIAQIQKILAEYKNPEEINDNPKNAPGKQLAVLIKGYRKVVTGKIISEAIGIDVMRQHCPHFADWLSLLEQLI